MMNQTDIADALSTWTPTNVYASRFRDLILTATLAQMEAASIWYFEAQEVAEDVAENLGASLEVGASIVSAFSPRNRWASNVAQALAFSQGKPVSGLQNNIP